MTRANPVHAVFGGGCDDLPDSMGHKWASDLWCPCGTHWSEHRDDPVGCDEEARQAAERLRLPRMVKVVVDRARTGESLVSIGRDLNLPTQWISRQCILAGLRRNKRTKKPRKKRKA